MVAAAADGGTRSRWGGSSDALWIGAAVIAVGGAGAGVLLARSKGRRGRAEG
jgi:hypothetical protein